jgi:predicted nuclease of predicted toxin-antitoxin system
MRFLIDESADARLAAYLTSLRHDVKLVARGYAPGIPDERVLTFAHTEQRILITDDRDFGELVFR